MVRTDKCPPTQHGTDSFSKTCASLIKLTFSGGAISMKKTTNENILNAKTLGIITSGKSHQLTAGAALHTATTQVQGTTVPLTPIKLTATDLIKENGFEEAKTNQEIRAALNPSEDVKTKYSSGMPQTSKPAFDRLVKLYKELEDKLEKIKQDTNQDAAIRRLYKPLISCSRGPEAQKKVETTSVCEDKEQNAC
uniref:Uncharacterized protein n=1 Tax=Trypanosoma brucei brucei (strain 927/4 GUTat10.1) TaxID=185431 RepID=Q4FKM5_TRYB2|nr:hypothetical protein Tb10.v4.0099 [Trypanosoma brucei brucei TREU927]